MSDTTIGGDRSAIDEADALGQPGKSWNFADRQWLAVLVLLVALVVLFSATQDNFASTANWRTLMSSSAILWVASIGLTFAFIVGGFDLSIGANLALSGFVLAWLYTDIGFPIGLAIVATVLFGFSIGALANGVLIGRYQVSFFIVTLGTLSLFRGIVNQVSDTKSKPVANVWTDHLAFSDVVGIPVPVIVSVVITAVAFYVLRYTYLGRDIYASGGNPAAAALAGIRVQRTTIIVFGIVGACAAIAGVMQAARIGAASPQVGNTTIFDAAAAVLLGGTSFRGGSGGVIGTALGVLLLSVVANGLAISGLASAWQQMITGAIVIGAAVIDRIQPRS